MLRSLTDPILPPAPRLSASEQTLRWLTRPYEFLRSCADEFGDTFTLDLGAHGLHVLFTDPAHVREVFTASADVLHAGKGNAILAPLLGERSLLLLESRAHLRDRRLLLPAFHHKHVARFAEIVLEATRAAFADVRDRAKVSLHDVLQRLSLDVICRVVFGDERTSATRELRDTLAAFLNDPRFNLALLGRLRAENAEHPAFQTFQRLLLRAHALIREEIAERRSAGADGRDDLVSLLLLSRDEEGHGLTDDEMLDELLTMVVTGHETTATAMAWGLSWLGRHPRVLSSLRAELDAVPPDDPLALVRLPYLDAVSRETLRIHPILPVVARQVRSPVVVGGVTYQPGITLAPCVYLAHRRAPAFPSPDEFRPERFLEREPSPYEFFPFGGGARRCLGMQLAMCEMKVALATIVTAFEIDLFPSSEGPVRRSVTIAPSGGVLARLRDRSSIAHEPSESLS